MTGIDTIKLLDLSLALGMSIVRATSGKGDGAPIDVRDGKQLLVFIRELERLVKGGAPEHLVRAWSNLTIFQRQLVTEGASRSGAADALSAMVGELAHPTSVPTAKRRPEPMFVVEGGDHEEPQ
jgi:hypothetical protein